VEQGGRRKLATASLTPSFSQLLTSNASEGDKRKGERTRDSLVIAAAEMLEEVGYRDLRVTDINERAGVSNALFYVYFTNKEAIAREVLTKFLDYLYSHGSDHTKSTSTEEAIYWGNLDYARRFAKNPGLMRCLLQFGDEIPEFGRLWRAANQRWLQRVVLRLSKEPELEQCSPDELWSAASAMGVMVDGFLRLLYIDREAVRAGSIAGDDRSLALFLTKLWVRGIFRREMQWRPPASSH
jgi:AcrR family transcriptional regulator